MRQNIVMVNSREITSERGNFFEFAVIYVCYGRKIRLKEGNAKCRHLKKLTCKGTLWPVFICLRPRTPYTLYPYTL
jgi:hypothetical protein